MQVCIDGAFVLIHTCSNPFRDWYMEAVSRPGIGWKSTRRHEKCRHRIYLTYQPRKPGMSRMEWPSRVR